MSRSPLGLRGFKYSLKFIKTLDYKSRSPLGLRELDSEIMLDDDEEFHEINKILAETYNYKYRRMSRG